MAHARRIGIRGRWAMATLATFVVISVSVGRDGADDSDPVTVATDAARYVYGDSAAVVVTNRSASTLLYSIACGLVVEGQRGETWRTVQEPDCSRIRVRPTRLEPGGRDTTWVPIAPGEPEALATFDAFRLTLRVQSEAGDSWLVHGAAFEVAPPAEATDRPIEDTGD